MALSYISNKEIKFGDSRPLNGVYTPGLPTREYEPLDSLGIYLNGGIPVSYGVENGRYMSMSDEFVASYQGNSYSFNQFFAAQMMLGFKLHDRFIACDMGHKIIGAGHLIQKAYLAEIVEKTLDYFKIKIYENRIRTFCIRLTPSEIPTSYIDLTNSFDEDGLNLTQTDRLSFLSYYRFYPLILRGFNKRRDETLGIGNYIVPDKDSLAELSDDIISKFNRFVSSDRAVMSGLGNTAFAYAGDVAYILNYSTRAKDSSEMPERAWQAELAKSIIGGTRNSLLYQTDADTTGFLPPGETGQILFQDEEGPAWKNFSVSVDDIQPSTSGGTATEIIKTDETSTSTESVPDFI